MKKIALITGANKGIGLETARQLGLKNYTVIATARDEARGRDAITTLLDQKIDAHLVIMDPLNPASVRAAVQEVEAKFGVLDVLINNAGLIAKADNDLPVNVPVDVFRETFELNVFALHDVTSAFWPLLNKAKAARLVNVSSALGSLTLHANGTFDSMKVIAYDSSKAAVNMMTLHYAHQWKNTPHKANTIHPGSVKTDMNPKGELSLEEGAKTSVDLATIGEDGPNGGFFHLGEKVPW